MKVRFSFGFQLACLVLVIALPAMLVKAYDFARELADKRKSSYAYSQSLANQCAHDVDALMRSAIHLLDDVTDLVQLVREQPGVLQSTLARILSNHPEYANIRLLNREGLLLVSAIPTQEPVSYRDRPEVGQAIAARSVAVGEPVMGKIAGVMTLPIAAPLKSDRGEIVAVASVSLKLEGLEKIWRGFRLPAHSGILLVDQNGLLAAKAGEVALPLGASLDPANQAEKERGQGRLKGIASFFGTRSLTVRAGVSVAPFTVLVTIPFASIYNPIARSAAIMLLADFIILAGATGVALYLGRRLKARVGDLRSAALEMASGDLDRPIPPPRGEDELGDLARALEQMRANLKDREGRLEEANRELESFAYSVSHDLRAPLRAIGGFTAILLEEYGEKLGEEGNRLLERVDHGAYRMGDLIDSLLKFSRVSRVELKPQTTDMDALLREVLIDYKLQMDTQRIELVVKPLGLAACDRGALAHAFSNLISNAMKYTRPRSEPRIEIGCDEGESETIYYVKDNGIGFDMKYSDKLTQVFQKLHPGYEGSGVGLAIVRRVVEKHGGRLWAVSAPEQGATFFFSLPRSLQQKVT
jgi:signal transduction histidine kinase